MRDWSHSNNSEHFPSACFMTMERFTGMDSMDKSTVFCCRKRFCGVRKMRIDEFKLYSPLLMGAEEDNGFEEASGHIPDSGLLRATTEAEAHTREEKLLRARSPPDGIKRHCREAE
ncbi:hypothetical protein QJS10_CPB17g00839 [Acorus calamus]|uniref:Uncharacterized protein n=1 Tax=Acorus calamus TaxID=4465 RepID=A0AAV9CVT7_ACOCL|nr:hypothetical protein QJS10_CPB17g00839 [Acorus calamus]